MIDPAELLTDAEVGTMLRKGSASVRKLRQRGELAFLPGRPPLTPRSAVLDYLRRNITTKAKPVMRVRLKH